MQGLCLTLPCGKYCIIFLCILFLLFFANKSFFVILLLEIRAGATQESVLGPILYLFYSNELPTLENMTVPTFFDDIALLAVDKNQVRSVDGPINR